MLVVPRSDFLEGRIGTGAWSLACCIRKLADNTCRRQTPTYLSDSKILLVLRLPRSVWDAPTLFSFSHAIMSRQFSTCSSNSMLCGFNTVFFRWFRVMVAIFWASCESLKELNSRAPLKFWTAGLEECDAPVADTCCCLASLSISC
jgi:hypothetical protein